MKLDDEYSFIYVCPESGDQLTRHDVFYSHGICPKCGHDAHSTITHSDKIVGRWNRPSLWERIRGKRTEFFKKEDEDAVWGTLKKK